MWNIMITFRRTELFSDASARDSVSPLGASWRPQRTTLIVWLKFGMKPLSKTELAGHYMSHHITSYLLHWIKPPSKPKKQKSPSHPKHPNPLTLSHCGSIYNMCFPNLFSSIPKTLLFSVKYIYIYIYTYIPLVYILLSCWYPIVYPMSDSPY